MKNLKVSLKLLVGFAIVILLAVVVGAAGIIGLLSVSRDANAMYHENTAAISALGEMRIIFNAQGAEFRAIFLEQDNPSSVRAYKDGIIASDQRMNELFALYEDTITDAALEKDYFNAKNVWLTTFAEMKTRVWAQIDDGDFDGALTTFVGAAGAVIVPVTDGFTNSGTQNEKWAEDALGNIDGQTRTLMIVQIAVLLITVGVAAWLAFYISGMISKLLVPMSSFFHKAGTTGDIVVGAEDQAVIGQYIENKDELGLLTIGAVTFVERLGNVSKALEAVANGDLTDDIAALSDKDVLGLSLRRMIDNLNEMFGDIRASTSQVSIGSKQIADGASSLAQGSTEQAASIEELSSSISEIADKTKANAAMAEKASVLADTIKGNAEKGSNQMDEMMEAVNEINVASQSISKVIKTIDDIAFQTNILALNAAVEAARAGQHGKGFAVVAEEVRNLAAKSAEAAKETGSLIENSIEKANSGVRIAYETAESLAGIVSGINESTQLVGEIARSSEGQSTAIVQINTGIDQVALVIQNNSATAEESAAASEEMSGQSDVLQQLIARFRLKEENALYPGSPTMGMQARYDVEERFDVEEKMAYPLMESSVGSMSSMGSMSSSFDSDGYDKY